MVFKNMTDINFEKGHLNLKKSPSKKPFNQKPQNSSFSTHHPPKQVKDHRCDLLRLFLKTAQNPFFTKYHGNQLSRSQTLNTNTLISVHPSLQQPRNAPTT